MKKITVVPSLFAMICFLGMSCSQIEPARHPSSLNQSIGSCQIVADDHGRQFQVHVNDKPYPNAENLSSHEAQTLMTRFSQTGTCDF